MEQDYRNVEEILENPGILIFKLNNPNKIFPDKKFTNKYNISEVNYIKGNIIEVFQNICENVDKCKEQNPEYLGHIVKNLNSRYNNKNKFNFPGLQVINMDREKLNYFTHFPERFLLCEKSDGVRYLLIQYKNGICHLVGRNLQFFEIYISERLNSTPYKANENEWAIDYLLDGELILDDVNEEYDDKAKFIKFNGKFKKINFLIFDAVVIKGINIGFLPFFRRLEELHKLFKEYDVNKYIKNCAKSFVIKLKEDLKLNKGSNNSNKIDFPNPGKLEKNIKLIIPGTMTTNNVNNKSITLFMKDYFNFNDVERLNQFIKLLPHHNDGLIINVDDYPYYSGQSCEIFKWKPIEMNTIDFEIKYNKEKSRYLLCATGSESDGKNQPILLPVEILCFKSDEEKEKFKEIFDRFENKLIAECFYDANLCNKETAINNYYLSKIKKTSNDKIPMDLSDFPNEKIKLDIDKLKGGWRFQRLRNDKSSGNFINTYQNIKVCIKENLHMEEILSTIDKNKNLIKDKNSDEGKKYWHDLQKESNFMSALIWKRFFMKDKIEENDDFDDDEFFHLNKKEDKIKEENDIQLLNKKRKKSNEEESEEKVESNANNNDYNNDNGKNDNNDDDLDDEDNLDKLYDDDYGDDYY